MFDLATLKDGARKALPLLSMLARLTPSKADDALVAFLSALLASETVEDLTTAVGYTVQDVR